MTEIIKTEGVVLKRRDFGETSRIAVAYTRDAGKVQLLAKGARTPKNKFGAALEPLSRAEFVFYWREGKELFTLSETSTVRPGRFIREDPKALPYGLAMAEAVDKLSGEGDADPRLYELLASTLEALDRGGPPASLLAQFLLKLAAQLGLKPDLDKCAACGRVRPDDGVALVLKDGTIVCRACEPAGGEAVAISPPTYNFANALTTFEPRRLRRVKARPELVEQTLSFIRAHLHYHTGLEIKSLTLAYYS